MTTQVLHVVIYGGRWMATVLPYGQAPRIPDDCRKQDVIKAYVSNHEDDMRRTKCLLNDLINQKIMRQSTNDIRDIVLEAINDVLQAKPQRQIMKLQPKPEA